jgi:hypothetical protein
MTASTGIQTALEKETDQYSVFTKHLIAGIASGEADVSGNGTITADDLYNYLYTRVREESHQEPTKWSMDARGSFIIANSGRKLRRERDEELRAFVFKLASDQQITDEILTEALEIIRCPAKDSSETDRALDALLNAFYDEKIDAVNFLIKWVQIRDTRVRKDKRTHSGPVAETTIASPSGEKDLRQPVAAAKRVGPTDIQAAKAPSHNRVAIIIVIVVIILIIAAVFGRGQPDRLDIPASRDVMI